VHKANESFNPHPETQPPTVEKKFFNSSVEGADLLENLETLFAE
jgi:hypothetical protein